eukprot:10287641-Alexandrium_andersonii.AAC.1
MRSAPHRAATATWRAHPTAARPPSSTAPAPPANAAAPGAKPRANAIQQSARRLTTAKLPPH